MPAEWEPHAATWLTWPYSKDWPGKLPAVRWVFCEIVRQLSRGERVRLIVKSAAAVRGVSKQLREADVDVSRVDFFHHQTDRTWARDNLPLFVTNEGGQLGAVKWRFNGWGRYPDYKLDDQAGLAVARSSAPQHWQPTATIAGKAKRLVLEGGSVDVDGLGTLLTTRRCLLGSPFTRNPGITQAQVEQALSDYLGASHVIWLEDGIAGDDTSGHIDDFARFVGPGRVVVSSTDDKRHADYEPLRAARRVLAQARDARGKKLDVVGLPMPEAVHYQRERLPASYANFYIGNECVLVPTFNDPADRLALNIFAELFPDRRVVGIHALDLVVGLGTLHCSTQQEPLGARAGVEIGCAPR
jgi:agmatine deiminase